MLGIQYAHTRLNQIINSLIIKFVTKVLWSKCMVIYINACLLLWFRRLLMIALVLKSSGLLIKYLRLYVVRVDSGNGSKREKKRADIREGYIDMLLRPKMLFEKDTQSFLKTQRVDREVFPRQFNSPNRRLTRRCLEEACRSYSKWGWNEPGSEALFAC